MKVNIYLSLAEVSRKFQRYRECEKEKKNNSMILKYISSEKEKKNEDENKLKKFDLKMTEAIVKTKKQYSKN